MFLKFAPSVSSDQSIRTVKTSRENTADTTEKPKDSPSLSTI